MHAIGISSFTLVMTACIAPRQVNPLVARVDPRQRLSDYIGALRYWLNSEDERCTSVLFLDNSGYPLDEIHQVAEESNRYNRPTLIRRVSSNDVPDGVSYGYAELGILDSAAREIREWEDAPLIVKTTGRLTFPDLGRLIDRTSGDVEFMADARNRHLPHRRTAENGVLTTQLMAFTPDFYRRKMMDLRDKMAPVKGHRLIESVLYRELFELQQQRPDRVRYRFPVGCEPRGEAAHWEKRYGRGRDLFQGAVRS